MINTIWLEHFFVLVLMNGTTEPSDNRGKKKIKLPI